MRRRSLLRLGRIQVTPPAVAHLDHPVGILKGMGIAMMTDRPKLPARIPNVRLVGMTFRGHPDWAKFIYGIALHDRDLQLVRDDANESDPYAVAVCLADEPFTQVGYLNRGVARGVGPAMDDGEIWAVKECHLAIADGHENHPGLRLNLERVEWAPEPPRRVVPMGFERQKSRTAPQVSIRDWAVKMAERAMEEQVTPRRLSPDQYLVPSTSDPGTWHSVVFDVDEHAMVSFFCDCTAATYHPGYPIPCSHSAAVANKMIERGEFQRAADLVYRLPAARGV